MSPSECVNQINKYKNIISKVGSLYDYIGRASGYVDECKLLCSENMLNGETIDGGNLDNISATLKVLTSALNTIVAECKSEIERYNVLYQEAVQRQIALGEADPSLNISEY